MMTDPIADLLTRIRNALRNKSKRVRIPHSKLKARVAEVLKREGYITEFRVVESAPADGLGPQGWLELDLKYGPDGEQVISTIERVSRPGRRVYASYKILKPVVNGLGIEILSTSQGVFSNREARAQKLGGEILARVY